MTDKAPDIEQLQKQWDASAKMRDMGLANDYVKALRERIDELEERTALAWIPASDLPEEKKYTPCLLAVWYRLAVDFSVTLEKGAYDGYSKSFEWKEGQYSNDENYTVLGWVPINCILLPPPPEQSDDR